MTLPQSKSMKTYWVYMLLCSDESFYTGVTNNVGLRLDQHNQGIDRNCYTFTRRPVALVHCAEFRYIDQAIDWEKQLKGWSRKKKLALIENDWARISELAKNYRERFGNSSPEHKAESSRHPSTSSG